MIEGHEQAFKSELRSEILNGEATLFILNEPVYREDIDMWSSLIEVRRPGARVTYWTDWHATR